MRTLFVMRHAEAAAAIRGDDFNRPLTSAGKEQAQKIGRFLSGSGIKPTFILHSPALRTKQTAIEISLFLPHATLRPDEAVYNASAETLYRCVGNIENAHAAALLVAHNPGVQNLTQLLTQKTAGFSPATVCVINCPGDEWETVDPGSNELADLIRPGE